MVTGLDGPFGVTAAVQGFHAQDPRIEHAAATVQHHKMVDQLAHQVAWQLQLLTTQALLLLKQTLHPVLVLSVSILNSLISGMGAMCSLDVKLNFERGGVSSSCSNSIKGLPCIAVPLGSAPPPPQKKKYSTYFFPNQ